MGVVESGNDYSQQGHLVVIGCDSSGLDICMGAGLDAVVAGSVARAGVFRHSPAGLGGNLLLR